MKNVLILVFIISFTINTPVYSEEQEHKGSTSALKKTGALLIGLGIIGALSKDSGGSRSSATFEAQKAGPLIALAGVTSFVIGNNKEPKLSFSYNQTRPVLAFSHKF